MSTRGDYSVVVGDKYFSCYQHTDMYPDGWGAMLLVEAADIAQRGEWDEIIAGWTAKAWVDLLFDEHNDAVSNDDKETLASSHPDGDMLTEQWVYSLRPRRSEAEAPILAVPGVISGHPSWRDAAAMPVMMKHKLGERGDLQYGVVVDADNEEIVLLRYIRPPVTSAAVIGSAPLNDATAIASAGRSRAGPRHLRRGDELRGFHVEHPGDGAGLGAPRRARLRRFDRRAVAPPPTVGTVTGVPRSATPLGPGGLAGDAQRGSATGGVRKPRTAHCGPADVRTRVGAADLLSGGPHSNTAAGAARALSGQATARRDATPRVER